MNVFIIRLIENEFNSLVFWISLMIYKRSHTRNEIYIYFFLHNIIKVNLKAYKYKYKY